MRDDSSVCCTVSSLKACNPKGILRYAVYGVVLPHLDIPTSVLSTVVHAEDDPPASTPEPYRIANRADCTGETLSLVTGKKVAIIVGVSHGPQISLPESKIHKAAER